MIFFVSKRNGPQPPPSHIKPITFGNELRTCDMIPTLNVGAGWRDCLWQNKMVPISGHVRCWSHEHILRCLCMSLADKKSYKTTCSGKKSLKIEKKKKRAWTCSASASHPGMSLSPCCGCRSMHLLQSQHCKAECAENWNTFELCRNKVLTRWLLPLRQFFLFPPSSHFFCCLFAQNAGGVHG